MQSLAMFLKDEARKTAPVVVGRMRLPAVFTNLDAACSCSYEFLPEAKSAVPLASSDGMLYNPCNYLRKEGI
ncbi:MAG TPA: hypothetical protein PLR48_00540 [Bacillota bacterium]|nr:hypothetical protein [Bacillota bacterium]HOV65413.1 hypothetical protein [Bacillota bacterium]